MAEHTAGGFGLFASGAGAGSVGFQAVGELGGSFQGTIAPLRLVPSTTAGKPTTGKHFVGELYVDQPGVLYYCTASGTPGTWEQVQLI
jgi:hypothetical protein